MTPEDLKAFQDRQEAQERPIIAAFLAWIARVRARLPVSVVAKALQTGDWQPVLAAVRQAEPFSPDLRTPAVAEARVAMSEVPAREGMKLSFDMQDPWFEMNVYNHGAWLIREIDEETRNAVQQVISNARRDGLHPRQFASQIRGLVGLTARQANAVEKRLVGMLDDGVPVERAQREADRYSKKLLNQRAKLIGVTETVRASNRSRVASFQQAARNGLFDPGSAYLEWMAVQTDPLEICFRMNGERVPLGQEFEIGLPPAHPACRCVCTLVLD